MFDDFEDHCWKDVVSPEVIEVYRTFRREVYVGNSPALVAIDLYEMVYQGGPAPILEVTKNYPVSCGEYAWEAIPPTQRLFSAARRAQIPIFYSTGETRPDANPAKVVAAQGPNMGFAEDLYAIRSEFAPQAGDTVIRKVRASAFFGTPLTAHLVSLGVNTVIMIGESTSGCLRASAVDAYSHGFHVTIVEECCFDRSLISHKINLFDLHHKYADVMHADKVIRHLDTL